MALKFRGA